jgi:hypothetical protein
VSTTQNRTNPRNFLTNQKSSRIIDSSFKSIISSIFIQFAGFCLTMRFKHQSLVLCKSEDDSSNLKTWQSYQNFPEGFRNLQIWSSTRKKFAGKFRATPEKPDFGWWTPFLRIINFGKKFLLYFNIPHFRGCKKWDFLSPGFWERNFFINL